MPRVDQHKKYLLTVADFGRVEVRAGLQQSLQRLGPSLPRGVVDRRHGSAGSLVHLRALLHQDGHEVGVAQERSQGEDRSLHLIFANDNRVHVAPALEGRQHARCVASLDGSDQVLEKKGRGGKFNSPADCNCLSPYFSVSLRLSRLYFFIPLPWALFSYLLVVFFIFFLVFDWFNFFS